MLEEKRIGGYMPNVYSGFPGTTTICSSFCGPVFYTVLLYRYYLCNGNVLKCTLQMPQSFQGSKQR